MESPFAVISDIHSNLEALDAVLDDIRGDGITEVVCLGDIVGYGPRGAECIQKLIEAEIPCLLGNHDEAAASDRVDLADFNEPAAAGIRFARQTLDEAAAGWLLTLPRILVGGDAQFSHASLAELPGDDWPYVLNDRDAKTHFRYQRTNLAFCGHTHVPVAWFEGSGGRVRGNGGLNLVLISEGTRCLVNVGSVGQPRDGDPRACYVICWPQGMIEFRRVEYDIEAAARAILDAGLPERNALRLHLGV